MRRFSTIASAGAVLLLFLAGCATLPAPGGMDPRTMTFPVPTHVPPMPERHVLGNGLIVFLLEDHEIPLVQGRALIRAGSVLDPPGKTGLARIAGQLLVQGGTVALPGGRLDEALEDRAIVLSGEFGSQAGNVTLDVPAADLDRGLELMADVLRRPALDAGRLETIQRRMAEDLARIADDPDALAFREFRRLLYGDDPRGRAPTVQEVRGIGREDVDLFLQQHLRPDRVILGFVGDFRAAELIGRLQALFGDWPASGGPAPVFPLPDAAQSDRGITLLEKDLPQATLVLGHLAPPKNSPDYVNFMLADHVLGSGGFGSRLTREIRSNRGLAYSVGSFYRGDIGYGVFVATAKTKTESTQEVLELIGGIAGEVRRAGVTAAELAQAREALVNGMIFRSATGAAVLAEAMALEYDGLPADFTLQLQRGIAAATVEGVREAAARLLRPDEATVVILGNGAAMTAPWPPGRTVRHLRVAPDGSVF